MRVLPATLHDAIDIMKRKFFKCVDEMADNVYPTRPCLMFLVSNASASFSASPKRPITALITAEDPPPTPRACQLLPATSSTTYCTLVVLVNWHLMTWRVTSARPVARRVIRRMLRPRLLGQMASYEVASNMSQALPPPPPPPRCDAFSGSGLFLPNASPAMWPGTPAAALQGLLDNSRHVMGCRSSQVSRVPPMAVNALRIASLESIDGQICHTMVQHGDSTVYYSIIGDHHLRYPGKLRDFTRGMMGDDAVNDVAGDIYQARPGWRRVSGPGRRLSETLVRAPPPTPWTAVIWHG